ncbi:unnamed protein product [Lepidochelys kempii]
MPFLSQLTCLVRRDIMIKASMSSGKVTLFHQDPQSEVTCRVPALLYILTDTLLAFTEKRSSARDEDAEYLVLRRSRKTGTSVEAWIHVGRKSRAKPLEQKPAQPSGELLQPSPCSLRGRQNQQPKMRL